jgi:hypothetical protein
MELIVSIPNLSFKQSLSLSKADLEWENIINMLRVMGTDPIILVILDEANNRDQIPSLSLPANGVSHFTQYNTNYIGIKLNS